MLSYNINRESIVTKFAIVGIIGIFLAFVYMQGLIFSALMKQCSGLSGIEYLCLTINKLPIFMSGVIVTAILFIILSISYCCVKVCHSLSPADSDEEQALLPSLMSNKLDE